MKILLSGGEKTQNIVTGIAKKFESSNDEFIVVQFMDNINEIYSKGDYYDKAIITEQSITREYSITDEYEIRNRVNSFATECAQRGGKQSYVFLTQDESMANIIYEEILPIERNSVVVFKQPPYSVGFFHSIIVDDVNQLPSEITFKPKAIQNEYQSFEDDTNSDFLSTEVEDESIKIHNIGNADDLFGFSDDDTSSSRVSDELKIDTGDDTWGNTEESSDWGFDNNTENWGDASENWDNNNEDWSSENTDWRGDPDKFGEEDENNSWNNNDLSNDWNNSSDTEQVEEGETDISKVSLKKQDEDLNIDGIMPIEQSGELPDYTVDTPFEGGVSLEKNDNNEVVQENFTEYTDFNNNSEQDMMGPLPGFDDEPDNNQSFSDELYAGFTPNDNQFDDDMYDNEPSVVQEQFNNTEVSMSNSLEGFDDDDYTNGGMTEQPQNQEIPNNVPMGFDVDDYDEQNNQMSNNQQYNPQEQFGNEQMNPAMMAAGAMAGMGMMANELNQQMNNQQINQQQSGGRKKGLFGKGNQQAYNQNMQQVPNQYGQQVPPQGNVQNVGKVNVGAVKSKLQPFAARGNSIVVTGCGGCGTSTVAYSMANILNQLGYSVLIVDLDTEGRTQSYITKSNYESMEPDSANLMSAINSSTGIGNYTSVVKEGMHLLTMGLGTDTAPVNELIHKEKISRFVNLAKTSYNFVIYDIPFQSAVGFLSEIVYMADNVVLVTDASNWGVTKTMLNMCNISSDEMQDTMFHRAQLVFNKYRRLYKVFGKKVKTCADITKIMDQKVFDLIGEDIGLHFENMHIAGIINDVPEIEDGWFSDVQYSDTAKGQQVFLQLIESIVLKG